MIFRFPHSTFHAACSSVTVMAAATALGTTTTTITTPKKLLRYNDHNKTITASVHDPNARKTNLKGGTESLELMNPDTSSSNRKIPTKKLQNQASSSTEEGVTATKFEASEELGVLHNSTDQIPFEEPLQNRELLSGFSDAFQVQYICDDKPLIPNNVRLQELVDRCLDPNKACPFDAKIGCWDTSYVTDMYGAFENQANFNEPIGSWNTASVTNMRKMFYNAKSFNQPIDGWKTSSVKDIALMFRGAADFNQPINSWDLASVKDTKSLFANALSFNQPLDKWRLSSVTSTVSMFYRAEAFNGTIDSWDVSRVTSMRSMFRHALSFNQPLDSWPTVGQIDMNHMFYGAEAFNQCLSTWATKTEFADTMFMLQSTGCPYTDHPNPVVGPWCQGSNQRCCYPNFPCEPNYGFMVPTNKTEDSSSSTRFSATAVGWATILPLVISSWF